MPRGIWLLPPKAGSRPSLSPVNSSPMVRGIYRANLMSQIIPRWGHQWRCRDGCGYFPHMLLTRGTRISISRQISVLAVSVETCSMPSIQSRKEKTAKTQKTVWWWPSVKPSRTCGMPIMAAGESSSPSLRGDKHNPRLSGHGLWSPIRAFSHRQ